MQARRLLKIYSMLVGSRFQMLMKDPRWVAATNKHNLWVKPVTPRLFNKHRWWQVMMKMVAIIRLHNNPSSQQNGSDRWPKQWLKSNYSSSLRSSNREPSMQVPPNPPESSNWRPLPTPRKAQKTLKGTWVGKIQALWISNRFSRQWPRRWRPRQLSCRSSRKCWDNSSNCRLL